VGHRDIPSIDALDPSWDLSVAGDTQCSALLDGKITRHEYVSGFNAFESCMKDGGFQLASGREVGGIFEFSIPDGVVKSGVDQGCCLTHFAFVDATWQYENGEECAFIERVNQCLGRRGRDCAADYPDRSRGGARRGWPQDLRMPLKDIFLPTARNSRHSSQDD
jgi:hypothetical protein